MREDGLIRHFHKIYFDKEFEFMQLVGKTNLLMTPQKEETIFPIYSAPKNSKNLDLSTNILLIFHVQVKYNLILNHCAFMQDF